MENLIVVLIVVEIGIDIIVRFVKMLVDIIRKAE